MDFFARNVREIYLTIIELLLKIYNEKNPFFIIRGSGDTTYEDPYVEKL